MAIEVVVTGIGLVSGLGNLQQTWQALQAGQSSVGLQQPFPELMPKPMALIGDRPTLIVNLVEQTVGDALTDAGLVPPLSDCGVVVGSSRGNQAQWEFLRNCQRSAQGSAQVAIEPALGDWLDTLPNTAAVTTARLIQTCGIVLAPMAACATGLWAIARGAELIRDQHYQRVIAGAVEAPITPLTIAGFAQMGALATTGVYPFDHDRQGLGLGEGGALFVLESAALAAQRGAGVYGRILGCGLTSDAYHLSAPALERSAAIAAIQQALHRSGISAQQVDYIHAHGTATQLNDRHEAALIQQLFPSEIPVSSTKGATGHTLGASGALGTAVCLLALRQQRLVANIGLRQSDFDLNLIQTATAANLRRALCFSFGFGGQNAVLAFDRSQD